MLDLCQRLLCRPDRVDPKADKIFEPPPDPCEVADAVAVGVLKGPWVKLQQARASQTKLNNPLFEPRPTVGIVS